MFDMSKEVNIFEVAAKNKYRFPFKGMISVEDLFDLRVEDLDVIFKALNSQVKKQSEESLLNTKNSSDAELDNKIAIVKHIFNVKVAEAEARELARENKAKKQKLMAILAAKQDEALQNMSMEDLQKMLDSME